MNVLPVERALYETNNAGICIFDFFYQKPTPDGLEYIKCCVILGPFDSKTFL